MLLRSAILRSCQSCLRSLILGAVLIVSGAGTQHALAAVPTFIAAGTFLANIAAISPAWPAGHQANDIGLMIIQTANQAVATIPAGWAQVTNSPQGTGTAAAIGSTRLTVLWKRAASGAEAALSIGDSLDHQAAQILVFRGVITTGNPWNVTTGAVTTPAATAVSIAGTTTTVAETLVVAIVAHARDANTTNTQVSGWANASLTGVTEITAADRTTGQGRGGGFGVAYGTKAAAGAYGATTATLANSSLQGKMTIALRPPITTLGNGTDPGNASIAPGGAATMADAFTFTTAAGTDTITAVVVGFAAGTAAGLSLVEITDDAGTTVYGSVADPATDTPSITLTTNITSTTTTTQYKIRVTPKSHANMPAPPGASYAVTANINTWTGFGTMLGSDTAGTTVTIDNASPANVSGASCTAGAGQVSLGWTNPADGDFNSAIVLRNTSAVADTPTEGTGYAVSATIGTSTVVCSTASTSCTDTGLTVGTAYHYKIFSRDTNVNYSSAGVVPTGSPCTPGPSSFNVVETSANPTTGLIFTKIAGQDIAVDVVALNASSTLAGGFTGTVAVELVDNTTGSGVCANMTLIKTLTSQTFTGGNAGRHPLSSGQFEANAYRNLKFRITYTGASPTVTNCSTDAFANRPLQFVTILARDLNRTTAGTTNTLSNTSNPGTGFVHNAGRPFRIDATAQNGAGSPATTTLYTPDSGQPVAVLSQCGVAAVCPASTGAVTTTSDYSAASGVITNTTASYNDVGSFNLALEDRTFSAIDAGDGTATSVRYIPSSAAVTVGRFVPDYFSLEAGSTITPRSDIGACSGSTFTYMSEKMTLVFTLKARDSGNNVTPNYTGATLGALLLNSSGSYSFGAIDSVTPTPFPTRLDLSLIATGATGSWSAGSASITAPLALSRAATPDGPYTSLKIGIAPSDPDTVTMRTADFNLDADNNVSLEHAQVGPAGVARFGRLRLQNASGGLNLDLPLTIEMQYWNVSGFVTNAADTCTTLTATNLSLGNYTAGGGINATNMGNSHITPATISFADPLLDPGVGNLKLTKPGTPATAGSAKLTVDLTAEAKSYLKGNWGVATYTEDPSARVSFGTYGAQPKKFIFYRENH